MTAGDVRDPFDWLDDEAEARRAASLQRRLVPIESSRDLVNLGSNDYLGLADDPRLKQAVIETLAEQGWGAGASPLVTGWSQRHQELAETIAEFEQTGRALLFPTGYAANLGAIVGLVDKGDAVYSDRLNHASIIDGVKLSGASLRVYPHGDTERLDALLKRDRALGRFRRSLIVTDGVFSMDGDLARLADLVAIAERWSAMLAVDEAHGTGVYGATGRGAAEACGVADRVPIKIGTLSKAVGSIGGFVAGSEAIINHLLHRAGPLIYSTSMPPAAAAASLAAFRIFEEEPWRRQRLFDLAKPLRDGLRNAGIMTPDVNGPIVPIILGSPADALSASAKLREQGFLVPTIRPPTVPKGTSRLRISLHAKLEPTVIDRFVVALADISRSLPLNGEVRRIEEI